MQPLELSVPCWSNSYIMLERCNFHEWIVASSWRLGFFVKSSWLWNNWVAVFSAQKQLHCNWRCYKSKEQVTKVGGIGAGVKVVDSHLCGWGSIPSKICIFLRVSLSKSLSLCFMCSDQHVKYQKPRGFPLTSSLLLDYHVKQYAHKNTNKKLWRLFCNWLYPKSN